MSLSVSNLHRALGKEIAESPIKTAGTKMLPIIKYDYGKSMNRQTLSFITISTFIREHRV